jgi:hypothetical protein
VVPAFHRAQPQAAIVEDVARELRYRGDATVVACGDPARVQRDLLFQVRVVLEERCDLWALASSRRPFLLLLGPNERRSLLGRRGRARDRHATRSCRRRRSPWRASPRASSRPR